MFLKYQLDWIKIVNFLLMSKVLASANNFGTPSSLRNTEYLVSDWDFSEQARITGFIFDF